MHQLVRWTASVLLLANAQPFAHAAKSEWASWRGGDAQGVVDDKGPTKWTEEESVRWNSPAEGEGNSSPIVVGDIVLITAAYPTRHNPMTDYFVIALTISSALCAILFCVAVASLLKQASMINAVVVCLLGGLLACEVLHSVQYAYCTDHVTKYLAWLSGHASLALACMITILMTPRRWSFIFALLLVGSVFTLVFLRPNAEYYGFSSESAKFTLSISWMLLGGLVLVAVAAIVAAVRVKRHTRAPTSNSKSSNGFVWCVVAFTFGFLALGLPTVWLAMFGGVPYTVGIPDLIVPFVLRLYAFLLASAIFAIFTVTHRSHAQRPNVRFTVLVFTTIGIAFCTSNYHRVTDTFARALICYDRNDGSILWKWEGLYGPRQTTHMMNTAAAPTPTASGGRVYAYFGTPGLVCVDMQGKFLWQNTDLPFEGIHGVAASPISDAQHVFVVSANSKNPYIVCLDGQTGSRRWKTNLNAWDGIHGMHRTPFFANVEGRKAIVDWGHRLAAYDCNNGDPIIDLKLSGCKTSGEYVASVLHTEDALYLPSKSEFTAIQFPQPDTEPKVLWQTKLGSTGPNMASPVKVKDLIFMVSDNGIATCLDAKNGKRCWRARLSSGIYSASPIVMANLIYFCSNRGVTSIVAAERKFRKVAECKISDEEILATPAPASEQLFIRTNLGLRRVDSGEEIEGARNPSP